MFKLKNKDISYLFGFIQTDGHLESSSRNRGKLRIEVKSEDRYLLEKFQEIIPYKSTISDRTRNTNYSKNYSSSCLSVYNKEFRDIINKWGIPYGKKSNLISLPKEDYSKIDYFRGIIDGDGSLGITKNNIPFLSLTTASKDIFNAWIEFIIQYINKNKINQRNKRDNIYNICIYKEDAQILSKVLYYKNCLCLKRKYDNSLEIENWIRPINMIISPKKSWDREQDIYILNHNIEDSMNELKRTKSSIETRLWRIKKGGL